MESTDSLDDRRHDHRGMFLFIGLFMLEASLCFFTIEDTSLMNALTYGAKEHSKYPIDIYGKGVMRFCTYIIPYTLIQYYPLQVLLGKTREWYFCILSAWHSCFSGDLLCGMAVWCKNYQSCGS